MIIGNSKLLIHCFGLVWFVGVWEFEFCDGPFWGTGVGSIFDSL